MCTSRGIRIHGGNAGVFLKLKTPPLTFRSGDDPRTLRWFCNSKRRHIRPSIHLYFLDRVLYSFILLKCKSSNREKLSSHDLVPISGILGSSGAHLFVSLKFPFLPIFSHWKTSVGHGFSFTVTFHIFLSLELLFSLIDLPIWRCTE